jgi:hypothetical protein
MMKALLLTFVFSFFMTDAIAKPQVLDIIRQPRSRAMGGVGIGLADDDYAMFNNVAGLGGSEKSGWRFLDFQMEGTLDDYLFSSTILNMASNFSVDQLSDLMGKDVGARSEMMTLIQVPHAHIAYIADVQGSLNQYNLVNPVYEIGTMITHGVQVGTAWSFKKSRRSVDEFRWGLSGKLLFRKGGYYELGTVSILQASADPTNYFAGVTGEYGIGIGGDLGAQYVRQVGQDSLFTLGASVTDVAGTKFPDSRTLSIPMAVNFGAGFKRKLYGASTYTLGLDYRNALLATSFSNKIHFGGEFGLGNVFFLRAGMNQLHATYGFGLDFGFLRIAASSFGEELDAAYGISTTRRFIFNVNLGVSI